MEGHSLNWLAIRSLSSSAGAPWLIGAALKQGC
jgi:hypothetical protein